MIKLGRLFGLAGRQASDATEAIASTCNNTARRLSHGKIGTIQASVTNPNQTKGLKLAPPLAKDTVEFSKKAHGSEFLTTKTSFDNLDKKIKPENFLGGGFEADVYAIDENYVLRMYGGAKSVDYPFTPVEDIFEGKNFGQAIARTKKGVSINKRVSGEHLYKCNDTDPATYMKKLREYSELSDETLDAFVSDVAFINSKGWRIDQTNPENFLYDKKTGRIGILDICKKGRSSLDLYEPYGHDWILDPLLNGHDLFDVYQKLSSEERKEMFELVDKIEKRIVPLCKKYNVPISKWKEDDYMFDSLINFLELRKSIDPTTCEDLYKPIIYQRYPSYIPNYEDLHAKKG